VDSQRKRFGQRGDSSQLFGAELGRQFDERERVAVGLGNEALSDTQIQGPGHGPAEKLPALVGCEPDNAKVRDAVERNSQHRRLVHGEEEGDQLGLEPAGDEGDRLDRRFVQPLGIVEEIEARLLGDCVGKERQDGEPHEEEVR